MLTAYRYGRTLRQLCLTTALATSGLCLTQSCLAAGPNLGDLLNRARAAQEAGDTALARTLLEPLLRAPSLDARTRANTYLLRARLFLTENAPVSALQDAQAATRSDPTNGNALSLLAQLYRSGIGIAADDAASARLYLKAARQGVVEAQREAGALLLQGIGIGMDLRKARYWLEQAANAGDAEAMVLLARSYSDAVAPAQRDASRAADWLRRAASLGGADRPAEQPQHALAGAVGGLDEVREP